MRLTARDGPDCKEVQADLDDDELEPDGWLHLDAEHPDDCGDYCSWQCLANSAMARTLDG